MTTPNQESRAKPSEADFMRLFVSHEPVLRAYAHTMLPDWSMVDDAIQEAGVTLWQKLRQLEDEAGFLPWAKVIVRYKCLQILDRVRRDQPVLSNEVIKMLADEAEPTTSSDFADVRAALSRCMDELSEAHQQLILAPYRGAGKVKEMAEQAGQTPNAFYKLITRLRVKLSACIQNRVQAEGV